MKKIIIVVYRILLFTIFMLEINIKLFKKKIHNKI